MRISFLMFSSRDSQLFIQIYAEIHYTIRLHSYQLALPVWRRFREINERFRCDKPKCARLTRLLTVSN